MTLGEQVQKMETPKPRTRPVWAGPESDKDNGGITFSLLSRFLVDRERFRLQVVEGLAPHERFNHRLEYGNMWHTCEEAHASGITDWVHNLTNHCQILCKRYPTQQEEIDKWFNVCKVQFPVYVQYWKHHADVTNRTPILQEGKFKVPYRLPSGREVILRGKWDSVDLIKGEEGTGIWLQENKTKGDVDEQQLAQQLKFDLQTMLYVVALRHLCPTCQGNWTEEKAKLLDESPELCPNCAGKPDQPYVAYGTWEPPSGYPSYPILGVRYNVIRRPLSGGRHSITRHKPTKAAPAGETREHFYQRLKGLIAGEPSYFFMRWKTPISVEDVQRFREQSLDPILEQLCDWWEWITSEYGKKNPFWGLEGTKGIYQSLHFRMPYGVYNPLLEGTPTDYDNYLNTGSDAGLAQVETLFPELQ